MGRGGPDTSSDKSRGKDPSVDPTAPVGHRGPITQDPKRPPDLNSPYTSEQTVKINGQEVPTGYTEYGFDEQGNPTVKFIPYTRQQLEAAAAQKAAEQQPGVKVRGASPTNPKASAPPPKASASPYNPNANAGAGAQNNNPWDNLAAGASGDYSKSKITTDYTTPANVAAGGGGGASSYSGIYHESAPGAATDTLENLLKNFANSGPDEIKKVQQEMQSAGIGSGIEVTGIADTSTLVAYRGLLQNTLLMQQNGQQITPDELLASLTKSAKSKTTTSTNVTLTNPAQAHQALTTAFGDKLGRKPTAGETLAFTSALNSYEKANPTTTSTTTDASGQNITNQTTTDKGVAGSLSFLNDYANNYAQTNPATAGEYHAAQALDFYNLALSSLANSPVSTGNPD